MPTFRNPFRHPDDSTEARFLTWTDRLAEPDRAATPNPEPDFADVANTATTVHRAVGIGAASPLPADRADAIWEQLMNSTTTNQTLSPPLPGNSDAPLGDVGRPQLTPPPGWQSYLLTAALIAVILVASIATIWPITNPLNGNGPDAANQPGFLASATPALESADGCPLTSDMFLVIEDESPRGDVPRSLLPTTAIVQADGDFVIICDGVESPQPLLSGVMDAISLPSPGAVLLELEDGSAIAYNIATDQREVLGDFEYVRQFLIADQSSPSWLLTPNNAALTDWRITNLEQMDSIVLSDEIGGVLPEGQTLSITAAHGSPVAAISFDGSIDPFGLPPFVEVEDLPTNPEDATLAELPANTIVVDETFETRRWIDSDRQVAVSSDGAAIAYQTQVDSVRMLKVEDAETGETLAEFTDMNFNNTSSDRFALSGDGESLVYLDGNDVWLATYDGEPTTELLETDGMRPFEVHATGVPGRVLIKHFTDDTIVSASLSDALAISIVNSETGEVTDLNGLHVEYGPFTGIRLQHLDYIITMSPAPASDAMTVISLVDIATGNVVLASEPVEGSIRTMLDPFFQASIADGGVITVVNVPEGPSVLFDVDAGVVGAISTKRLSDAEGYEGTDWTITPSSDGHYLMVFGFQSSTRSLYVTVSVLSTEPEWAFPPIAVPVGLIRAIPTDEADDDEPAALQAQDATPLEASPAATPAE